MSRTLKFLPSPVLPEFYEVSDTGIVLNEHGKALKQSKDKDGYPQVVLVRKPQRYTRRVHSLVAGAFLGDKPTELHQINHKNGKRDDNRVENLEWVTSRENTLHGWASGRKVSETQRASARKSFGGSNNPKAKLTVHEVEKIRTWRKEGRTLKEIANYYHISVAQVSAIARNKFWV
jgi:hypothetical protein